MLGRCSALEQLDRDSETCGPDGPDASQDPGGSTHCWQELLQQLLTLAAFVAVDASVDFDAAVVVVVVAAALGIFVLVRDRMRLSSSAED